MYFRKSVVIKALYNGLLSNNHIFIKLFVTSLFIYNKIQYVTLRNKYNENSLAPYTYTYIYTWIYLAITLELL